MFSRILETVLQRVCVEIRAATLLGAAMAPLLLRDLPELGTRSRTKW
jgi:hypothetical protein